jgi:anti-anti-sigma regulatory factor
MDDCVAAAALYNRDVAPKFEAEIQQLEQLTYVKLAGVIDEDNELAPLSSRIRGDTVIIDLSSVQDINNCGVRNWVKWREEMQARGISVVLVECSPAIVAKLNSVTNFNNGGFIKSFYVPYYCQACETEKAMLVDMDELRGEGAVRAPTCRCDACDGVMAFDDMEESYFAFVKDARKAVPPDTAQQLVEQLAPSAGERKILSRIPSTGSSFAGIPSTGSPGIDTGASGSSVVSGPSASSLRRLRDKTGLRTLRRAKSDVAPKLRGRKWLRIGAGVLVLIAVALAVFLVLR